MKGYSPSSAATPSETKVNLSLHHKSQHGKTIKKNIFLHLWYSIPRQVGSLSCSPPVIPCLNHSGQVAPALGSHIQHVPGLYSSTPARPHETPQFYSGPWGWDRSGCPVQAAPPSAGFHGHGWAESTKFSRNQPPLRIFSGVPVRLSHTRSSHVPPQADFP